MRTSRVRAGRSHDATRVWRSWGAFAADGLHSSCRLVEFCAAGELWAAGASGNMAGMARSYLVRTIA